MRPFDWCQSQRPWMTLNGRYAVYYRKDASFKDHRKNLNEDRPISATKMQDSDSSFWRYQIYADIRRGSVEMGRQKTGGCRQRQFSTFSLAILFENFREEATVIIQQYGDLLAEKCEFFLPHSHLTLSLEVNPFEFLDELFVAKTRVLGLSLGDPSLCRFDSMPACDRQTDGQPGLSPNSCSYLHQILTDFYRAMRYVNSVVLLS